MKLPLSKLVGIQDMTVSRETCNAVCMLSVHLRLPLARQHWSLRFHCDRNIEQAVPKYETAISSARLVPRASSDKAYINISYYSCHQLLSDQSAEVRCLWHCYLNRRTIQNDGSACRDVTTHYPVPNAVGLQRTARECHNTKVYAKHKRL